MTGYRITVPFNWPLACQSCNGPIEDQGPHEVFSKHAWAVPKDGGLRLFHDNETCPPLPKRSWPWS